MLGTIAGTRDIKMKGQRSGFYQSCRQLEDNYRKWNNDYRQGSHNKEQAQECATLFKRQTVGKQILPVGQLGNCILNMM